MAEPLITQVDIAWAAGLFEGEGCCSSALKRPHQTHMTVTSTDRDVLLHFQSVIGAGKVRPKPMPADKPHWTPGWTWEAAGDDAVAALLLLLPYLGERRRARALELITIRVEYIAEVTAARDCRVCGGSFRPRFHGPSRKTFLCSPECYRKWQVIQQRIRTKAKTA
jgi:hypothetical protein